MERLQIRYDGQQVGTLAVARGGIFFEYARDFIASGHELSPLQLPLGPGVRARDTTPTMRLPGLFEDSLPDRWGERLMLEWFRARGLPSHEVTPLMMLSYVGNRAMGALAYEPEQDGTRSARDTAWSLAALHEAAEAFERQSLAGGSGRTKPSKGGVDLAMLAEAGSSVGGARPKALIGLPLRGSDAPPVGGGENFPGGYEAWIVKFDTSADGSVGPMEEAFARMARAAGIEMPETQLVETRHEGGRIRRHFAVRRFDREEGGRVRIHFHSLAGMCQMGGGDLDYTTLLRVARRITHDEQEVSRAWRRAVFNVLASNRDDHGKNHGFLYRDREWHLSPAYDLTFSSPAQLPERGMAVSGERRAAGVAHVLSLARAEGLDARMTARVIDEVREAISRWGEFAEAAGVHPLKAAEVSKVLRKMGK